MTCDCLNRCGDDPGLQDGRATRCCGGCRHPECTCCYPRPAVDTAIVGVVLPLAYQLISDLLDASPQVPKELRIRAGRLLPAGHKHSLTKP